MQALGAFVARENIRGGVTLRMADVQARAGWVGKHVENVKFGWQLRGGHLAGKLMTPGKRVPVRKDFARIKGAKGLLFVPKLLPFRFDQMKRILSAAARHTAGILRKAARRCNGGVSVALRFFSIHEAERRQREQFHRAGNSCLHQFQMAVTRVASTYVRVISERVSCTGDMYQ